MKIEINLKSIDSNNFHFDKVDNLLLGDIYSVSYKVIFENDNKNEKDVD